MATSFPFDISFVCVQLGIATEHRRLAGGGESFYSDCPFCQRRNKFNINLKKNTFRCAACDEAGGMLSLYERIRGVDTKTATRELYSAYNGTDLKFRTELAKRSEAIKAIPSKASHRSITERDAVNRAFLSLLTLSDAHKKALLQRGLSEEQIAERGYRSYPQYGLQKIADTLTEMGYDLDGIPPFYKKSSGRFGLVYRKPAIVIPVRNNRELISYFTLGNDKLPEDATEEAKQRYAKYTMLSSSEKDTGVSVSGMENIHFSGFEDVPSPEAVCLTEGILKADVANALSGVPFIGLPGVNNTAQLPLALNILKANGVKRIYECMDMDMFDKPQVMRAAEKIHAICEASGLEAIRVSWLDTYRRVGAQAKGIDDLLLYRKQKRVR